MVRSFAFSSAFLLPWCMACALILGACRDKEDSKEEPTEPWRRDEVQANRRQIAQVKYEVASDSQVSLALPTKRAKPEGSVAAVVGQVAFDPNQLQFVRGSIKFDLDRISMNESVRPPDQQNLPVGRRKVSPELEAELLKTDWTAQAKNWLGLGVGVADRSQNRYATFTIESARDLSHARALAGAHRAVDENHAQFKQARLVDAIVVGTLSLRHLSVARSLPVRILFYYKEADPGRETAPDLIEVSLRAKVEVPLLEYDIKPRGADGHVLTEMAAVLGYWVGESSWVNGSIRLEKVAL